jgi:hypothetical protein
MLVDRSGYLSLTVIVSKHKRYDFTLLNANMAM